MIPHEIFTGLIIVLVISIILTFRFYILAGMDKERIASEIEKYGHSVDKISWNPFGRGWFGEKGERYYDVKYTSNNGQTVETGCKTSLLTGVFWTEKSPDSMYSNRLNSRNRDIDLVKCYNCGKNNDKNNKFCPSCGKEQLA